MGLISKTVKVKICGSNIKWYKNKGYEIPECINKRGKLVTKIGSLIEVKIKDLPLQSMVRVKVKCDNCDKELNLIYSSYSSIVNSSGEYYCQKCAIKLYGSNSSVKTKLKKSKSFEQWCNDNLDIDYANEILSRWDTELNRCLPSEVTYNSEGLKRKGYWFKCDKGIHESEQKNIVIFTKMIKKNGVTNSLSCNKCNSFAQWGINNLGEDFLKKYWDYEKNAVDPWEITKSCGKKVFIKCQNVDYHESYNVDCDDFCNGGKCPYCLGKRIHPKDSLGQYIIDNFGEDFLNKVWSEKNKKSPFEYFPKSGKNIWWRCPDGKHEDFIKNARNATNIDFHCSNCVRERDESFLQEKVRLYLESFEYTVLHENKCTIVPKNPKTKLPLPFDNEILELSLVIEVHGIQHYKTNSFHIQTSKKNNTTPELELHYQQLKDRYKRIYTYMQGYNYLEIPYWTDNKDNEWKQLIDNKIQEILKLPA